MTDRKILLNRIMVCDFALDEVALFLDTHPEDKEALAYYKKHLAMKNESMKEYTENYGPLTQDDGFSETRWKWIDNPWPWENVGGM